MAKKTSTNNKTAPRKKSRKKVTSDARRRKTTDDVWRSDPDTVRQFIELRNNYEQLCAEVAYILRKRLQAANIEFAAITFRAKTLNSFLNKLKRKTYSAPFDDVTDFAGVRVVCLYVRDLKDVESIIHKDFKILETVDKLEEKQADQFGYLAKQYIVKLGQKSSGARYDDLKNLVCEVQVRTVLQDAWAIIQYHLVYKQETDVPKGIQRKLNSLAGLFETADDQFDRIRDERESYVAELRGTQSTPSVFLQNEINLDSLREYITWKFPTTPTESWSGQLEKVLEVIDRDRYPTLKEIDKTVNQSEEARSQIRDTLGASLRRINDKVPAAVELYWGMFLDSAIPASEFGRMPFEWIEVLNKAKE